MKLLNEVLKRLIDYPIDENTDVRKLREDLGLSVKEAAKLVGVSRRTWERYENGSAKPNRLTILTLKMVLGELPEFKVFMF